VVLEEMATEDHMRESRAVRSVDRRDCVDSVREPGERDRHGRTDTPTEQTPERVQKIKWIEENGGQSRKYGRNQLGKVEWKRDHTAEKEMKQK
jgi:hypothetical protein